MKYLIFVISSIFFTIYLFNNNGKVETTTIADASSSHLSPLVAYGKQLYMRESCNSCHTLKVEHKNAQLTSLDGVGGKYSNSWLFHYLDDPLSIIPNSKKSSYKQLYTNTLRKEMIAAKENDTLWQALLKEADSLELELKHEGITTDKKEIIALIAYMQQIPASEKKMELDSIERVNYLNEQKLSGNADVDDKSIIIKVANDEANKEKGNVLFQANCSPCHGTEGQGIIGPNLTDAYWLHGGKKADIANTIMNGVLAKGMISWKSHLTPTEIGALIAFIASINGTNPDNAKAPQGIKE
ncbi:c-type cytochrome [Aureibaculum sp. A20]|uniref:C-type cytochrome n=1 Tax=Aureibaculum flavum TaxID=2795986 RepID=A0ABS0WRV0_9FLAO|nr:c-type cytochrome [Aureibaculum flavum]MBJ2174720.1 c-type cytochrome [Aureibaculum flavum]